MAEKPSYHDFDGTRSTNTASGKGWLLDGGSEENIAKPTDEGRDADPVVIAAIRRIRELGGDPKEILGAANLPNTIHDSTLDDDAPLTPEN